MPPRKPALPPLTLDEVMATLEAAGSEQTRKIYLRHGAQAPLFGVSFATLKPLVKRIGVDQDLAVALWDTGNHDARVLAAKVADPARLTEAQLDAWATVSLGRGCTGYVAMLAGEGPHARSRSAAWLASPDEALRRAGWMLVAAAAMRDEATPDDWFAARAHDVEAGVHAAPNARKEAMMGALIAIGCRSEALRDLAVAVASRLGRVDIDVGDTDCKVPVVADSLEKAWAHSLSKGFPSPAAHERTRENLRTRC